MMARLDSWLRRRVIRFGATLSIAPPDRVSRSHNPGLPVKRGPAFLIALQANLTRSKLSAQHGLSHNPQGFPGSRKNGS